MCPFGWRIIGTIFGILMVPLMYVFAKRLFGKTSFATITCILLTFDFMHLAQTRIATIDVYVTFFVILMYYFMYKYYEMSFYDTKLIKTWVPLLLSGIAMGLGIASKWTGCYAAVGLAIIFFYTVFKRYKEYKYALKDASGITNGIKHDHIIKVYKGNLVKTILFCFVAFIGIPLLIYTLSYIPFIGDSDCPDSTFGKMVYNIEQMFAYHTNVEFEHGFSSRWYEWPLMIRPIFYYSGVSSTEGFASGISSFGNPLVWWFGIASFVYVCYRLFSKKDRYAWFFFVGYLAQLMPWVLVERLTFIYHYFPCVPFVALMNGYVIYRLVKDKPKNMKFAYIYAALVVVVFAMFYPVLTGKTVNVDYVTNCLRWVKTWVLISG
jgi:dolichyl-phosphate-mannose--protein O-mannosyl transferase